MNGVLTHMTEI